MDNFYDALALYYDTMQSDMDAVAWADFISKLIKRHSVSEVQSITDLGCGTGSVTVELAKKGYDMTGIDSAEEMLAQASAKEGAEEVFWSVQDITDFDIGGKTDCFISTLDTVDHITDGEALERLFASVGDNLENGGLFIFDAITEHHLADTLSDNVFYEDYDDFTLLWVNDFDPETKINTAGLTLFALTEEGLYERFDGELVEKYYPPEFFTAAGEKAGLVLLAVYGELKDNDPSEEEERIFYVFRKEGGN
ncbi:MAG: class I SAM-dependent methyltransferase [Clostridiales bacterium]|nr:class I SAM-dependent methyltransferase [Clostridiales bacterium]MBR6488809.1 class I SAM-dependent methyltransferase [Clostridiales bacterium]